MWKLSLIIAVIGFLALKMDFFNTLKLGLFIPNQQSARKQPIPYPTPKIHADVVSNLPDEYSNWEDNELICGLSANDCTNLPVNTKTRL